MTCTSLQKIVKVTKGLFASLSLCFFALVDLHPLIYQPIFVQNNQKSPKKHKMNVSTRPEPIATLHFFFSPHSPITLLQNTKILQ